MGRLTRSFRIGGVGEVALGGAAMGFFVVYTGVTIGEIVATITGISLAVLCVGFRWRVRVRVGPGSLVIRNPVRRHVFDLFGQRSVEARVVEGRFQARYAGGKWVRAAAIDLNSYGRLPPFARDRRLARLVTHAERHGLVIEVSGKGYTPVLESLFGDGSRGPSRGSG